MLVTIYGSSNYGNVLQRCALSRAIELSGFEVWHVYPPDEKSAVRIFSKNFVKQVIKHFLVLIGVDNFRKQIASHKLAPIISKFQNKYCFKRIYMTSSMVMSAEPSQWSNYDYAVTGSDQVWNFWGHADTESGYAYLSFMPREKRVCYAPSFGFTEFPDSDYEFHKKGLEGFDRLSCREQEMIPMIKSISGKDAQLVLDPTLLLNASQWREFVSKPDYDVPEKYVLCYFLGTKTPEYHAAIQKAAGDLPVISVYEPKDTQHYMTDPGGFLWLIDHADFVCTDSFHGIAFSVSFGKNFLAFRRKQWHFENMFGRISGLLDSLNITGHIYEPEIKIRPEPVNYTEAYSRLAALRESSMHYLKSCLHVN